MLNVIAFNVTVLGKTDSIKKELDKAGLVQDMF